MKQVKNRKPPAGAKPRPAERAESARAAAFRWDSAAFWAALAAALGVLFLLALPELLGRVYVAGDLAQFHIPVRKFYGDCLHHGLSCEWFPHIYCGYDLHGEGQVGMYHPAHWALYKFLASETAFQIETLLHYPLMLLGLWLFLSYRGLPPAAALLGAGLFGFSAFSLLHLLHLNMVAVVAHLPWLLLACEIALSGADRRRVALTAVGAALVVGSMLLLGHPQAVWLSGFIVACYVVMRAAETGRWTRLAPLTLAALLGVVLGAVQLWPSWEALSGSLRQDASAEFRAFGSMHPLNLLQIFGPYLFKRRAVDEALGGNTTHELGIYAGAVVPVLLIWLALRWKAFAGWRVLIAVAAALAVLGLVLALGSHLPAVHWVTLRLPVVGLFRCPSRYSLWATFAFALLGALAFADLARVALAGEAISWRRLAWLAIPPVLSAAALVFVAARGELTIDGLDWRLSSWRYGITGIVLSLVAMALVVAAARGAKAAPALLAAFAILDLGYYGVSHNFSVPPLYPAALMNRVPRFETKPGMRVAASPPTNLPTVFGTRMYSGYSGLVPSFRLRGNEKWAADHVALLLRLGSVETLFIENQRVPVPDPLPPARLVATARQTTNLLADVLQIDCATTALVEGDVALDAGPPGAATLRQNDPGRIRVETNAPGRQLLVLSENYHPGWQATIAGKPVEVIRVYGDLMGCVVPSGAAEVDFRFRPASLVWGRWISVAGVIACGIVLVGAVLLRDREPVAA